MAHFRSSVQEFVAAKTNSYDESGSGSFPSLDERVMRSKGFEGMVCSIAGVMGAIGDRWGLLILRDLILGISRYDDFRQSSGVTNATLSDRLKHLEANGLVERQRYQTNPERFEYFLTEKGRQIAAVIPVLAQIGDQLGMSGASAPPIKFVNRETGEEAMWGFIDKRTGKPLHPRDLAITEGPGADALSRWRLAHGTHRRQKHQITAKDSAPAQASKSKTRRGNPP
ncbi:winged helix-turn-helix transcriptional regulator [Dyella japonica]|uniref:DNA-binding HxlR family transcriptional regulator n=1 Tax=Dyella japonica TaxID=231455 RepID=A0ABV2JSG5_9GAMM